MCGIAGFAGRFDPSLLGRMNASQAHRGPDAEGIVHLADDGIGLAHRRLTIIDLSDRGQQPMWDASRSVVIVYNGEIYNYRALRDELRSTGSPFLSDCDTEVLLQLYLRDGVEMLRHLNGIFAFALWDTRSRRLFLARDGLGVKPLYWCQSPRGFLFASEMKAILQEPSIDRGIDPEAVRYHLQHLWCPSPYTMLEHVQKMTPGQAMVVRDGRIERCWQHYDLPYQQPEAALSEDEASGLVQHHVRQAVERQLVADVPIGAFLSGGLDSSSVVAMAKQLQPDERIQCFTIGMKDPNDNSEGMGEDLPFARQVAAHLDVDLHTVWVGPEMVEALPAMIFHLDEPQADPAPINAYFISRLAREHGIKVLLSGAGGDDIFTGYRRHYALLQEQYWSWLPAFARRGLVAGADHLRPSGELRRRVAKAFRYADLDGDERIASYFNWLPPAGVASLFRSDLRESMDDLEESRVFLDYLARLPATSHPLNRLLALDGRFFLADHNLNYADKVSMAHGVEVRVPLLDPDLVALACRLPVSFKQRGSTGKWIFRKAMEPFLPRDVIYRKKAGFGAPLRGWLRGPLRMLTDDLLSDIAIEKRGLFDAAGVRRLVALDRAGRVDAAYTIFALICIELWCRMFVDKSAPAL